MSDVISEEIHRIRLLAENNAGRNCNVCGEDAVAYLVTPTTATYFVCKEHYDAVRDADDENRGVSS
jgi:hypothetical protein